MVRCCPLTVMVETSPFPSPSRPMMLPLASLTSSMVERMPPLKKAGLLRTCTEAPESTMNLFLSGGMPCCAFTLYVCCTMAQKKALFFPFPPPLFQPPPLFLRPPLLLSFPPSWPFFLEHLNAGCPASPHTQHFPLKILPLFPSPPPLPLTAACIIAAI